MGATLCACGCREALPTDAHALQKYVDSKHQKRMEARRRRRRKRDAEKVLRVDSKPVEDQSKEWKDRADSKDGRATARRGQGYEYVVEHFRDVLVALRDESISTAEATESVIRSWPDHLPQLSQANWSRWGAAFAEDEAKGTAQEGWSRDVTVQECLEDFEKFCRRYWPDDMFTDYMREWSDAMNESIDHGGRLLLLCPQRHFKSDTLIKWCTWQICKNFDIRLLWVSQTQDLAEKAVGMVLDNLTHNEQLIADVLGPGREFRPPTRNNMSWTSQQFTVGVRSKPQKSPTMVALGKGGSVLSRDADGIVVDDLQEYKHIRSPGQRETDVEWFFSDLTSRKLPHTGLCVLGSRQHLQDVYSEIMKRADQWTTRIYQVHDPACTIPEDDHDAHVDCMLNPDWYPHDFMQEQREQQGEAYFQRNMMNNPKSDATVLVSAKDIERCKDYNRRVGDIPKGVVRLVAGIDPSDAKPVAAVLWGHESPTEKFPKGRRHVIDIMEADAGLRGGRQIVKAWKERYGCTLFIIESNMAQSWLEDTELREFCARHGVVLKPQYTSASTKWAPSTGVVAMFGRMRSDPPTITLPWGGRESEKKMERLAKTFLIFDPDYAGNKHADDDLPMAAWFPQLTMDNWLVAQTQQAVVDYRQTPYVPGRTAYVPVRRLRAVEMEDVA